MVKQRANRIRIAAATGLVVMALASAPANAHHGHNYVAPLAAFIAFNSLFHHNHYRHHGHHGRHGKGHRHQRRHSHSHGGYHNPRKKRHDRW